MALVKRVVVSQKRTCSKCGKVLTIGSQAIKDRRSKYKINGTRHNDNKKIIRDMEKPTTYTCLDCYKRK